MKKSLYMKLISLFFAVALTILAAAPVALAVETVDNVDTPVITRAVEYKGS